MLETKFLHSLVLDTFSYKLPLVIIRKWSFYKKETRCLISETRGLLS